MKYLSVIPNDPKVAPVGRLETNHDGEPFAVIELDGGDATLHVGGGLSIEQQCRYLRELASTADALIEQLQAST